MPRGEGTGPFGTGPQNSRRQKPAGGGGRHFSTKRPGACQRDTRGRVPLPTGRESRNSGGWLPGVVIRALGTALLAIPALLKTQSRLQAPESKVLPHSKNVEQPVIEIKPVHPEKPDEFR